MEARGELTQDFLGQRLAGLYRRGTELSTFHVKKAYGALLCMGESEKRKDGCGTGGLFDALIAAYLLNPLKSDYAVEDVAGEYLGRMMRGKEAAVRQTVLAGSHGAKAGGVSFLCGAGGADLFLVEKKTG